MRRGKLRGKSTDVPTSTFRPRKTETKKAEPFGISELKSFLLFARLFIFMFYNIFICKKVEQPRKLEEQAMN